MSGMGQWEASSYKDYKWIVADQGLLGGKLAIRGTRLSVSFILSCLAEGMSLEEIQQTYAPFPRHAIPEIMKVASECVDARHVAASRQYAASPCLPSKTGRKQKAEGSTERQLR